MNESREPQALARVACALVMLFFSSWALNAFAFPLIDSVAPFLRDLTQTARGLALVVVAVLAARSLKAIRFGCLMAVTLGTLSAGIVLGVAASATQAPLAVVAWAFASAVGSGLAYIMIGVACMSLRSAHLAVMLPLACAFAYVLQLPFSNLLPLPPVAAAVLSFAAVCTALPDTKKVLSAVENGIEPTDAQIMRPQSFPSFANQVFVFLFVFSTVRGIALMLASIDSSGKGMISVGVACALGMAAVYAVSAERRHRELDPDLIFYAAFLCSLAGLALLTSKQAASPEFVAVCLHSGESLFLVVAWYVLTLLGKHNTIGAVRAFAWGTAAMSFGVVLGAALGRVMLGLDVAPLPDSVIAGITIVVFAGYIVFFVRNYSFAALIKQVEPVQTVEVSNIAEDSLERRCAAVAAEHGLTKRETEIMELLARGRNGHFIAETLVISYNTVKTHVSHIYEKLGVHSQQEVIDLVERHG